MFKKYLVFSLSILVINLSLSTLAFGETKEEKDAKFAEKVKANITKLGTGTDAKIEVKLKDGTKLKGYIREVNDEQFVVVDSQGNATPIPFPQAKQVKGNNLSTGVKIAIGVGIALAVLFIIGITAKD